MSTLTKVIVVVAFIMTHTGTSAKNVAVSIAVTLFAAASPSCEAFAPLSGQSQVAHAAGCSFQHRTVPTSPEFSNSDFSPSYSNGFSATSHQMLPAAAGLSMLSGAITGGLFAGGLHAIAGPDHIAALLPRCSGKRWYLAGRIGALWGLGHGISATLLGVIAFFFKNRLSGSISGILTGASSVMEIAVGLSLVVIGAMGLKEAIEWKEQLQDVPPQSLSSAANDSVGVETKSNRSVILNGLIHGLSWDGAPSLAPAIALATWRGSLTFLLSYAMGTIGAMTVATTLIGEGTRKAGEVFERPNIPQQFSFYSSLFAILVGCIWVGLAAK